MALLDNQSILASGSDHPSPQIFLWDLKTLEVKMKLREHRAAITAICCLKDGEHMVSGSYDKKICVYSYREGGLKYTLPSNKSSVTSIVMNVDGSKMISCGLDHIINIWQVVKRDNVLFFL